MTTKAASLRVSRTIRASAERLFDAWTDVRLLRNWWWLDEGGWSFADASLDLRPGGAYRLAMRSPTGETHAAVGVYREVIHPSRLVFTWDWENEANRVGPTVVTVEFKELGGGLTEVTITHEQFREPARARRHEEGWSSLLRQLDRVLDEAENHSTR